MNRLVISILLLGCVSFCAAFRLQSVGVRGTLMCGNRPLANTRVKLWDEDDGVDPDDELDSTLTDSEGRFELSGSTREMTPIDPKLKIYHDCNNHLPCQRKVKITIPNSYINSGSNVRNWFDAGQLNMQIQFQDEERSCLNF
uniref:Uncharacterized protein n=1 Tax=Plectus sambesii TaxID=2011161 RepID=A0A914V2L6_9BILA